MTVITQTIVKALMAIALRNFKETTSLSPLCVLVMTACVSVGVILTSACPPANSCSSYERSEIVTVICILASDLDLTMMRF